jgi:hypothetical protein
MTSGDAEQVSEPTARPEKSPPPWTRAEVILACEIHVKNRWRRLDHNNRDVLKLSALLRSVTFHGNPADYGPSFRNNYSVSRKTSDLKTANPGSDPAKKTHGGKVAEEVIREFIADTPGMLVEAAEIRASLSGDFFATPTIPTQLGGHPAPEGPVERVPVRGSRPKRVVSRADKVKKCYSNECQICGHTMRAAGGTTTSQGAHLRALKYGGPDHPSNIVCLCGSCHAEYDAGGIYIDDDLIVRDAQSKAEQGDLRVAADHVIDKDHLRYHRASFGLDTHPDFPPRPTGAADST